jgi:uncharacterized linocin/CFP29 family protein
MMDILKRDLAPITDEAWKEIDDMARDVLKTHLSARRVVDVNGPDGIDTGAISTGRLDVPEGQDDREVRYGINIVQPLLESRIRFELDIWELDTAAYGARDINFDNLEKAAKKIALFEENAIYHGFDAANIEGIKGSSPHEFLKFSGDSHDLLAVISSGITGFVKSSIPGPYSLVVGPELWKFISSQAKGFPLKEQIEKMLGGEIILNPLMEEAYLFSTRGGDMALTLGRDFCIGYHAHDTKNVQLYLTESFTFRIVNPWAIIELEWNK